MIDNTDKEYVQKSTVSPYKSCQTHIKNMYRITESKLKIIFKDDKVKKSVHNSYCSDNDFGTFFLITIH